MEIWLERAQDPIFPPYPTRCDKNFTYIIFYMMSDILSMRLKSAIAVFVFGQLDPIFLCVAAKRARRTRLRYDLALYLFKGVLHFLPKISMFCALFQNNQYLFKKKITHAWYKKLFKELKNGIEVSVGRAVFKL